MFPWQDQQKQRQIARRLIGTSLLWLAVGGFGGLLLALQRMFPGILERWSWWVTARMQLYHSGILFFGFCVPLLMGLWFVRLQQLHQRMLRVLPLWEAAYMLWQFALVWGVGTTFLGSNESLPTLYWQPVIYGILFVASLFFALAITLNLPNTKHTSQALSLRFLMVGVWAIPAILLIFLFSVQMKDFITPSLRQILFVLGFLFPLLGLLLPPSLSEVNAPDSGRLSFFYWAGLFCLPLSASAFSAALAGSWIFFLLQCVALASVGSLLYTLMSWWRYPLLYKKHWLLSFETPPHESPLSIPHSSQTTSNAPTPPVAPPLWLASFQWGALCLGLAITEMTVFSLVRALGNHPSPTWSLSHMHLLLVGAGLLWFQGIITLLHPLSEREASALPMQRIAALVGVLLFAIGSWWEGLLHFYLEQNGLPRGALASSSGQWLRGIGSLCLVIAFWGFARMVASLFQFLNSPNSMTTSTTTSAQPEHP